MCDASARAVIIFDFASEAIISTIRVDGVPTGASLLERGEELLAVVVHGHDEEGAPLPDVANASDRLEIYRLVDGFPTHQHASWATGLIGTQCYPNGVAVVPAPAAPPLLFCANCEQCCTPHAPHSRHTHRACAHRLT